MLKEVIEISQKISYKARISSQSLDSFFVNAHPNKEVIDENKKETGQ